MILLLTFLTAFVLLAAYLLKRGNNNAIYMASAEWKAKRDASRWDRRGRL